MSGILQIRGSEEFLDEILRQRELIDREIRAIHLEQQFGQFNAQFAVVQKRDEILKSRETAR